MNNNTEQINESVKAEITVIFKTCNLMDSNELSEKYNGNITEAVIEMLKCFSLSDLIEENYVIYKIKILE